MGKRTEVFLPLALQVLLQVPKIRLVARELEHDVKAQHLLGSRNFPVMDAQRPFLVKVEESPLVLSQRIPIRPRRDHVPMPGVHTDTDEAVVLLEVLDLLGVEEGAENRASPLFR